MCSLLVTKIQHLLGFIYRALLVMYDIRRRRPHKSASPQTEIVNDQPSCFESLDPKPL